VSKKDFYLKNYKPLKTYYLIPLLLFIILCFTPCDSSPAVFAPVYEHGSI